MSYNADNMSLFLGSDVTDTEADAFAQFLENRGWDLLMDGDGLYRAYRDGEEMTESEWQAEMNAYPEKDASTSDMSYTVHIGEEDCIPSIESPEQASNVAMLACKENPGEAVFVSWFRDSDGCQGFLNRGGDHEPTGRNWQK